MRLELFVSVLDSACIAAIQPFVLAHDKSCQGHARQDTLESEGFLNVETFHAVPLTSPVWSGNSSRRSVGLTRPHNAVAAARLPTGHHTWPSSL